MIDFKEIENRDAWAVIRGFVYQVDVTILRWLSLKDNQILELEKGEDIDIVCNELINNTNTRDLEQVKYREANLTLNQQLAVELLLNFYIHKQNNPAHNLLFRFVSNTGYTIERPALFPDGRAGIEVWMEIFNDKNILEKDKRVETIAKSLRASFQKLVLNKLDEELTDIQKLEQVNLRHFINYIEKPGNVINLIRNFEWSLNNESSAEIANQIKTQLEEKYASTDAETAYSKLFLFIFKLLSNNGVKTVTNEDLVAVLAASVDVRDQKLFNALNSLLDNVLERLNKVEDNSNIQAALISRLIEDVDVISKSDVVLEYRLANISITPPPVYTKGTLRKYKAENVLQILQAKKWVAFQGIHGTGKTQLAALVSTNFTNRYWLDLRVYNSSNETTALLFEQFLSSIAQIPLSSDRSQWMVKVIQSLPENCLIVLNDIPRILEDSPFYNLLGLFIRQTEIKGIRLLTTSNFKIPNTFRLLASEGFMQEYYDFEFSDDEIIEVLENHGAENDIQKYVSIIAAITNRNPRLVSAIAFRLKTINWGKDQAEFLDVLLNREFKSEILEDAQLSIKSMIKDDTSKELLYRLSLINWGFTDDTVKFVSEVQEEIKYPQEKLSDLVNLWIQRNNNIYSISPLILKIGENNLSSTTIKSTHLAIAHSILSKKSLDLIAASRCMNAFLNAEEFNQAGSLLVTLYHSCQTEEEAKSLNKWGFLSYWADIDMPLGMGTVLKAIIRNEQIRLSRIIGTEDQVYRKWLVSYLDEGGLSVKDKYMVSLINILQYEPGNLKSLWKNLDYVLNNWGEVDSEYQSAIDIELLPSILWLPAIEIQSSEDIIAWLKYLALVQKVLETTPLKSEEAQDGITVISARIIKVEESKSEQDRDWEDVLNKLALLYEFFSTYNYEVLEAVVIKEICAVKFNIQEKHTEVAALVEGKANAFNDLEAKYLLYENLGKLFYRIKQEEKSLYWLERAISLDCFNQTNFIDTLIYAAAIVSIPSPSRALQYCERALLLAEKRVEYLDIDYIQILAETGIALWLNSEYERSFEVFDKAVATLFKIKEENATEQWIRLFSWIGHSLGYISAEVIGDKVPTSIESGDEYVRPYQGIVSFNTRDLTSHYKEEKNPLVMMHLAFFADGINKPKSAYEWSLKAFDLARKIGDQTTIIMIAASCSSYATINLRFDEALEASLLFAAFSAHLKGSSKEKFSMLDKVDIKGIYLQKPSEEWNIAEATSISHAVIPMFIIVLTRVIEKRQDFQYISAQFLSVLENYLLDASNKKEWEILLTTCKGILDNVIKNDYLIELSYEYSHVEDKNIQLICSLGIVFRSTNAEEIMQQLLNITPYLQLLSSSQKAIVKFAIVPFVLNKSVEALKDSFVGNKKELDSIISTIQSIDISKENALQLILQPVVKEVEISLDLKRSRWLYDYIAI